MDKTSRERRLEALSQLILAGYCCSRSFKPGELVQVMLERNPDLKEQIKHLTSDDTMSERVWR